MPFGPSIGKILWEDLSGILSKGRILKYTTTGGMAIWFNMYDVTHVNATVLTAAL